ncbi:MAG: hypothetical protein ACXADY_12700 [Candidatus Hodarchaeales archaeon]
MDTNQDIQQERFYLITVDMLKGLVIFPMIFGHGVGWWDRDLSRNYEKGSLAIMIIWITGLMVFPCFLFISGFNNVNSFLKNRKNNSRHKKIRLHTIKRSIIFLAFATIVLGLMSIIQNPAKFFNYLFTWHLLHLFAFSTLFLLLLFELTCWFERKISDQWSYQQSFTFLLLLSFIAVIALFVYFHDYTIAKENLRMFPVALDILSISENVFLDISSCSIIPWLSFSLAGGLTASLLNLPCVSKINVLQKSKLLLLVNILFLIVGLLCLRRERFVSAGLGYASSFSHVFISMGLIGCISIFMILLFDIYHVFPRQTISKVFYPVIIISNISLTIYLVHPVAAIIDPSVIPSEAALLLLLSLYCMLFIILAHLWQKWDFKYSFEWIVKKLS